MDRLRSTSSILIGTYCEICRGAEDHVGAVEPAGWLRGDQEHQGKNLE